MRAKNTGHRRKELTWGAGPHRIILPDTLQMPKWPLRESKALMLHMSYRELERAYEGLLQKQAKEKWHSWVPLKFLFKMQAACLLVP